MTSNRNALVIVAVATVICSILSPLAIRGVLRYKNLLRMQVTPESRARLLIQPTRRTMYPLPHQIHPINLGYATFDIGSTSSVSIEAMQQASVVLTNKDVCIVLLPPTQGKKPYAKTPKEESTGHPDLRALTQELDTDIVSAQATIEEAQPLPFFESILMSNDDFLLHSMKLISKGFSSYGLNGVQIFTGPESKGIVWIGKSANDNRFAHVLLASADGTRRIGLYIQSTDSSSNNVPELLDPILRSFRFTADQVDNRDRIKTLIEAAGIPSRPNNPKDGALTKPGSPSRVFP